MEEGANPDKDKKAQQIEKSWLMNNLWWIVMAAVILIVFYSFNRSSNLDMVTSTNIKLEAQSISTSTVKEKIAVISIIGEITENYGMVEFTAAKLQAAVSDPDIKAIILKVESPGGSVNASDLIWNEVIKAKKSKKPIVAFYNQMAASGGYYISVPANKIIATPSTITGSIGVIMQILNISGLMRKINVQMVTVKSGKNKDMFSPFKPVTEANKEILQALVNEHYSRFIQIVSEGRKMDPKKVRELADGRIYSAKQAKENGLIDEVGYFDDAVRMAQKLSGYKDASPIEIQEKRTFTAIFSQKISSWERLFKNQFPKSGLHYSDETLIKIYQSK